MIFVSEQTGRPNNAPQAMLMVDRMQQLASQYARLYVAGIHSELTETDVREVFESFGTIRAIEFPKDPLVCGIVQMYPCSPQISWPSTCIVITVTIVIHTRL